MVLTFNVMQQLHSRQQLGTMLLIKYAQIIQIGWLQFLEQFQILVPANGTIGETIQQKICCKICFIYTTYPLSTNTEVYSLSPMRISRSSTELGPLLMLLLPLLLMLLPPPLLAILAEPPGANVLLLELFMRCTSGNTSTLMNLKCPTRPWQRPFQMPDAFIDSTSMSSPFCKKEWERGGEIRGCTVVTLNVLTLNLSASLS